MGRERKRKRKNVRMRMRMKMKERKKKKEKDELWIGISFLTIATTRSKSDNRPPKSSTASLTSSSLGMRMSK
jgi:hypothetical protein